jgi:hypothetical protein
MWGQGSAQSKQIYNNKILARSILLLMHGTFKHDILDVTRSSEVKTVPLPLN